MRRFLPALAMLFLAALLGVAACSPFGGEKPPPEPRFEPGEYGGEPLPGTEHLYNLKPSPDGSRIALIREYTPGEPTDPRNQLWIINRDGSDPELIGVNVSWVRWSPDGKRLAVTVSIGINFYIYVIDLQTLEVTQWTGEEDLFFSKPTVGSPVWFQDGTRLLVSVAQKAYQQPFERGIYTINTETGEIDGPLVELMEAASLGDEDRYAIGMKYTYEDTPLSGNYVKYIFATDEWKWITSFSDDSLDYVEPLVPSPTSGDVVYSRKVDNAEQLFLMNSEGENERQITELGGDNPRWSYDGTYFIFRRDVYEGEGARYVPFTFDMRTMEASPLWPALPDSVPDFPALSTQSLNHMLERR